ncbi:calmodulin-related [Lithospermum erythrorhizon]|uniref:Calmodulin-related n=1 Tax=Lithospermum erythrorhizon TaxID=34254 RepID=A0AAV3QT84_LITER
MGQIIGKVSGKQWRENQLRRISDEIFDRIRSPFGTANVTFQELYIAVLLVYNDINKISFGAYIDPPSKEQIKAEIEKFDINHDGELSREEFARFISQVTRETILTAGRRLLITMVIAPTIASLSKKRAEGVPGVGKLVQKTPHPIYASFVTFSVLLFQRALQT